MLKGIILATGWLVICLSGLAQGTGGQLTYAERLGWPRGARVVLFHCDDAGMSHSSNLGAREALEAGIMTSVSTMMPCSWVPEWAKYLKEHPETDNGIHLTLTSEWDIYRWGPVAGKPAVPSLVDEQGCLWDNVALVVNNATPDDIETEIRAQIDRAETMGMPITHLDSHMGTLFAKPEFFERWLKVAVEKQIPLLMVGGHLTHASREQSPALVATIREAAERVWNAGLPVLDDVHTASYGWRTLKEKRKNMIQVLRELKPGVTEIIVHCTRPTEEFVHISVSGPTRYADLQLMTDPKIRKVIREEGLFLTTWRELKQRRDRVGPAK